MKTNQLTPLAIEENNKFKLQKYYWILYKTKDITGNTISSVHPMKWMLKANRLVEDTETFSEYILLDWKEITKEEYDLWNS